MALFVAPTWRPVISLSRKLKFLVRGIFFIVDFTVACVLLTVVLIPVLVAMQIWRIKQWSEEDE